MCGDTLGVEWINVQSYGDRHPMYMPGQVECPNRCDPRIARLLTREDGPIFDQTGKCVSLGLAEEIRWITGNRDATLTSVIHDLDEVRRYEVMRRLRGLVDCIGGSVP